MKDGKKNGAGIVADSGHAAPASPTPEPTPEPAPEPAPEEVQELAEACVRFVERALGVKLDYQPETLPLLDHYIDQAREVVKEKPEMLSIVAQASGAYFGEVVRRRHASWWRTEGADPSEWQIELEPVFLAFSPVKLVLVALLRGSEAGTEARDKGPSESPNESPNESPSEEPNDGPNEGDEIDMAQLTLEEEDRLAVYARLADLPPVSEREFCAMSTRLEVIDIAVEAIQARHLGEGEEIEGRFKPEDYE